ncbi:hypothetical protein IB279_25565 [Ensifer sp. ENS06]|uniref:hypothetical protein n=1 Tax=Ensifer sp. ENS06 TaxID=2769276 RepID=UPI000DDF038D|nr:hypothetical protein [Ensifer sp. ENS06]MBD9626321.1 hypothetical protein [Ensifer sp. ENS06]
MKPQQRKFIVEVRSARRRTTTRPSSIWGDTDLKALAQEIETEASHLFGPAERLNELSPAPSSDVFPNEDTGTNAVAGSSDLAAEVEVGTGAKHASGSALIPPLDADLPKTTPPKKSKRQGSTRLRRRVGGPIVAAPPAVRDELAALEEENSRLKGLLVRRLQQENMQLRKMLERF